ncbi:unnamed protein product [Mesocestoides corti]|uniref:Uncharacterized protein n=1 Tax=Mesocestoides corti TaxID=53468 RepID=A0A0R3UFN0_MESCO|nr:unnamed protein product [Mesocestoides corti]
MTNVSEIEGSNEGGPRVGPLLQANANLPERNAVDLKARPASAKGEEDKELGIKTSPDRSCFGVGAGAQKARQRTPRAVREPIVLFSASVGI